MKQNVIVVFLQNVAKAILDVVDLNCMLAPEKIGNPNGMQIMYNDNGGTRSIFVYAEDSKVCYRVMFYRYIIVHSFLFFYRQ